MASMDDASFSQRLSPFDGGFAETSDGCRIHYSLYCSRQRSSASLNGHDAALQEREGSLPQERLMMITGIATDLEGWKLQIEDLLLSEGHNKAIVCCVLDNRGIGLSSEPTERNFYSTERMAQDVLETADSIGWRRFHLVGFSMGGMIACKLATQAPHRLSSLTILSTTGGGWQTIPRNCFGICNGLFGILCCGRTLKQKVDHKGTTQFDRLMEEYMQNSLKKTQSSSGFSGQLRACWNHGLTPQEYEIIQHGTLCDGRRGLAHPRFGRHLAKKLGGKFIEVDGAHMIKRECRSDVSYYIMQLLDMH